METVLAFFVGILSSVAAAFLVNWLLTFYSARFTFGQVMKDVERLHASLKQERFDPDLIVGIDRNGSIVASILSGYYSYTAPFSIATKNERMQDGSRRVSIPAERLPRPELLTGKKVLVLICFNGSGSSLEAVYRALSEPPYDPAEIQTASLYTSISPRQKPHYYAREAGSELKTSIERIMTRMPWMTQGWQHIFAKERLSQK